MYQPNLDEIKKLSQHGNLIPVYREFIADLETPVSAFLKLGGGEYSFLLESVEGGRHLARYSFIGIEPYKVIITHSGDIGDPLQQIERELDQYKLINLNDLPVFCGGAVGYLSYDTARRFEKLPEHKNDALHLPEALFMFVNSMVVFDHLTHKIKVISLVRLDTPDIDGEYKSAVQKIDHIINVLHNPLNMQEYSELNTVVQREITSNMEKVNFEKSVKKIKQYISNGEAIQVVLSQRFSRQTFASPFALYRALRSINPSPYMFFLNLKDFHIIGASPEVLVRVENGKVLTRPLAGTRPRGKTPQEDMKMEEELRKDEKERAEHIMLVDLGRNDIGRISTPGSVRVTELMEVERYSHVMHLVSNVEGILRKDKTMFDALRACFPAGTVSGAPKIRAMQIIAEFEKDKRGPYAGAVGYFSFSQNMDMAIAIRTLVMKQNTIHIQSGCGIVYDSVPEKEYEETLNKARALFKAVEQAEEMELSWRRNYARIDR